MNTQQTTLEFRAFEKFATHYPKKFNMSSLRKMTIPKPDLEIDLCSEGTVAFEVSEIIDREMIAKLYSAMKTKKSCDKYFQNLSDSQKKAISSRFSYVYIIFQNNISAVKRERAIPPIFNYLLKLVDFEREHIPQDDILSKIVKKFILTKKDLIGPFFGVDAGGGIADPSIERIKNKYAKKYITPHPCELLLYYDLQPEVVSEFNIDDTIDYAKSNIASSSFQRVWIYSFHKDKVIAKIER